MLLTPCERCSRHPRKLYHVDGSCPREPEIAWMSIPEGPSEYQEMRQWLHNYTMTKFMKPSAVFMGVDLSSGR